MRIIAFAGPAGAGKTTHADYLSQGWAYTRVSFAGPLKDMLAAGGFGRPQTLAEKEAIIPELGVSWRHAAQTLGTEWGRKMIREDLWTMLAMRKLTHPEGYYVFDDLRFENEAKTIREAGGQIIHLVGRTGGTVHAGHASEQGIEKRAGDWLLDVSGTIAQTHCKLDDLLDQIWVG